MRGDRRAAQRNLDATQGARRGDDACTYQLTSAEADKAVTKSRTSLAAKSMWEQANFSVCFPLRRVRIT